MLSVDALDDCAEKMRMLAAAGMVLEEAPMKSENFIRNAFSVSGTVKCRVHFQPLAKVSSAEALERTVSTLLSASGVEEAVVLVDVAVVVGVDVAVEVDEDIAIGEKVSVLDA